jgi:hypothetical protein
MIVQTKRLGRHGDSEYDFRMPHWHSPPVTVTVAGWAGLLTVTVTRTVTGTARVPLAVTVRVWPGHHDDSSWRQLQVE